VSLASLALTLVAVEIGLRLTGYRHPQQFVSMVGRDRIPEPFPGVRYVYTAGSHFEQFWPGNERNYFDPETNGLVYRLNNFGFRDDDFSLQRSASLRIAILGDSFAFGIGVRDEDTFATIAERELNQQRPFGLNYEIYNFGLSGIGTEHEAALFDHVVRHFQPDIVIVWYVLNDVNTAEGSYVTWKSNQSLLGLRRYWWFLDLAVGTLEQFNDHRKMVAGIRQAHRAGHKGYASIQRGLQRIATTCQDSGTKPMLFIHPWLYWTDDGYPFEAAHRSITELGVELGYEVVDLTPYLMQNSAESLYVHSADHHPNEVAHRIAAEVVCATIETKLDPELLARPSRGPGIPPELELEPVPGGSWYHLFRDLNAECPSE